MNLFSDKIIKRNITHCLWDAGPTETRGRTTIWKFCYIKLTIIYMKLVFDKNCFRKFFSLFCSTVLLLTFTSILLRLITSPGYYVDNVMFTYILHWMETSHLLYTEGKVVSVGTDGNATKQKDPRRKNTGLFWEHHHNIENGSA